MLLSFERRINTSSCLQKQHIFLSSFHGPMLILLIENDPATVSTIIQALREERYSVDRASNGEEGLYLARFHKEKYKRIILDDTLPDMDSLEVCHLLRQENSDIPILMLFGQDKTAHIVDGLKNGADEYLLKPFKRGELRLRVRALQRRQLMTAQQTLSYAHIELNPLAHEVKIHGRVTHFTPLEFRLLQLLMENQGRVVTRSEIIEKVWDMNRGDLFSNSVNVHVKQLRKKIQEDPQARLIHTIRGYGYKFAMQESEKTRIENF